VARSTDSHLVRGRQVDLVPDVLAPPLVEAKLAAPRLRADMLPRPRIGRALDAADEAALTLVSAPPGYGKTTAARAWCHGRQTPLAWVTLDTGDNDPVRLWTYLAAAVDRVRDGLGRRALQRLKAPGVAIESAIDELTNGIAAYGSGLAIVVDDVHAVTDQQCLASIDRFVAQLPATAQLLLIGRSDPALRLARLRANGALAELRARELAFTQGEAHELLVDRGGLNLAPAEIELLVDRTEGWPAALVLAALWLRAVPDPGRAVREFGGGQHFVAEYLSQEVLGSLDEATRSFLVRASVLGRFTAELCDGVFDRSDSASRLGELERSNLFVIPLEHGGWFRIHSLLAEFARLELASVEPGAALDIQRRAAEWLRARGFVVEAAEHGAAAGDHDFVAELLSEYHLSLIGSGGARTLLRCVRTLPEEQLLEHPELTVSAATAAAMIGHSTLEQRRLLRLASRAKIDRPDRSAPYVEAVAAMLRAASVEGDVATAVRDGERAVAIAEAAAEEVLAAALAAHARALYFSGDLDHAWTAALRAVEHSPAETWPPGHAFARATLALVAAERGRLGAARAHAEKAKAIVGHVGSGRTWLGANAAAALGVVLAGEGDLAKAERELGYAERFFRDDLATVHHAWLLVLLAHVHCRRGRFEEAEAALDRACEEMAELGDSGRISALAEAVDDELDEAKARAGAGEIVARPSVAELAVLELLATDLPVREIARKLFLSPNTVRSHSRTIYRKLGVNSRAEAVARAEVLRLFEANQIT
jgi:LuxR family transcriptional regulator, maltose regulon positive regulatory protein